MRIVMVAGSVSRRSGGLFWSVRRLSQSLRQAGADVHVLGLRDPDTAADLQAWAPLTPVVLDRAGPAALGYAPGLSQAIARLAPDILHLHGIWQALSASTARWAARDNPVMISPRGMLDPWAMANSQWKKRLVWHAYERANLHRAACLHALSASEAEAIRAVLPQAEIAIVPNGVDVPPTPATVTNETPSKEPPADGRPRLLFVSRVHPKKGLMEFLDHWALVRPRLSRPWVLRIAGQDEVGHLAALRAQVERLGLSDSVAFIGPVYGAAKAQELAAADAFVLPSKSEGLPMAVLEAWAAGLPVLMTRACNLPEGFEAGAAIELTGDPEPLFVGLEHSDLPSMGARGRALVEARFGWEGLALRHLAVYDWILQNRPDDTRPLDVQLGRQRAQGHQWERVSC